MNDFLEFDLKDEIMQGLTECGFKLPSPVQKEAIPLVLQGFDLIAQAHTGTGKTAAFGLPIMSKMNYANGVETLVITPTRELAMQISEELYRLGKYMGVKTATVYGGQSYSRQIKQVQSGANIVVATPGRLLDLLDGKKIEISPSFIVLDEADEMLDMGFIDDVKKILSLLKGQSQRLLFSATMPEPIKKIADKFLKNPKLVQITTEEKTNKDISQEYYVVEEQEREIAAIRLIDFYDPKRAIIFCRMKKEADILANNLLARGYPSRALHGDMEQRERELTIKAFKKGDVEILVATDVAARGLDISSVSHVFNYHIPFDAQSYVHRIGRTGRAGKKGLAITLVTPLEFRELQRIKKLVGTSIEHKFIPTSKELSSDLTARLISDIKLQETDERAADIIKKMQEELSTQELLSKLLSMILSEQNIEGPDKIGLDLHNINKLLQRLSEKDKYKKDKKRPFGRGDRKKGSRSNSPRSEGAKSDKSRSDKSRSDKSRSDKPRSDKPKQDKKQRSKDTNKPRKKQNKF